nr:hypothetical protein BHE74_00041056 [Ipomoea batatas]
MEKPGDAVAEGGGLVGGEGRQRRERVVEGSGVGGWWKAVAVGRRRFRRRVFHVNQGHEIRLLALHLDVDELGLSHGELRLELVHLLLEVADRAGAAVHGVSQPRVRLVHQAAHGVRPLCLRQDFDDIAGSKDTAAQGLTTGIGAGVAGGGGEEEDREELVVVSLDDSMNIML